MLLAMLRAQGSAQVRAATTQVQRCKWPLVGKIVVEVVSNPFSNSLLGSGITLLPLYFAEIRPVPVIQLINT
jgi:hypothetical protein